MEVSVLSSGSSGNCFYIEENGTAILVDAGISCKQILLALQKIKKDPNNVKAIFITHEHSDHIKGADVLARSLQIPIYANKKTLESRFICSNSRLLTCLNNQKPLQINNLTIKPFTKNHAAADPISYTISHIKQNVAIITDLGFPCLNTIEHISKADFLCIESNHDYKMLQEGPYPAFLKQWITSDTGHLSNKQAALTILEHAPSKLSHIILSHISEKNNSPEVALKTFKETLKHRPGFQPKIEVSSRFQPTPLIKL
jgi:phosphoribosyl 1,2-cyclic phosphodiesterase